MRNTMLKTLLLTVLFSTTVTAIADEVFLWNDRGHNTYSDTPNNLPTSRVQIFNVRNQSVSEMKSPSAAAASDPDAEIKKQNEQVEERNKQVDEKNKKIAEDNKRMKREACRTAQMNRKMADSLRVNNRDALIQRYNDDVNTYCN